MRRDVETLDDGPPVVLSDASHAILVWWAAELDSGNCDKWKSIAY